MNRRKSTIEIRTGHKGGTRTPSLDHAVAMPQFSKGKINLNNGIFQKRLSSADLMIQKLKVKLKLGNGGDRRNSPSPTHTNSNSNSGLSSPCKHHPHVMGRQNMDERSKSLGSLLPNPCPRFRAIRQAESDEFNGPSDGQCPPSWRQPQHSPPECSGSKEWREYQEDEEDEMIAIQNEIYRAKSEAKTVSIVDGCLYINYQYVGQLPAGCMV